MSTYKHYTINFDGGCTPKNPGGIAIASWVIRDSDEKIVEIGAEEVCRGDGATNNVAEWAGPVMGLKALAKHTNGIISIIGDSLLVINQLNGEWRVKQDHLKPWKEKALEELKVFDQWKASHVRRHLNEDADKAGKDKYKEIVGET